MNYDTIIVEMLSRIQALENQVKELEKLIDHSAAHLTGHDTNAEIQTRRVTTAIIRDHIEQMKQNAAQAGEGSLTIRASDIHKAMQLKSRFPMVCNAMRQCMSDYDEVVHDTPSGYSSTLEITYHLI